MHYLNVSGNKFFGLSLSLALLLLAAPTDAQTDAYHDWLLNQLNSDHGISGGEWVFGNNEASTTARLYTQAGVTRTDISIADMPFTQAVRLKTEDRPTNFWEYSATYSTQDLIPNGDVLLAVFWIRGLDAERGKGFINSTYELGGPPYNSMYVRDFGLGQEWQQWLIPFQATEDLPSSWLTLKMGYLAQEIEIGGVAVINYGNAYEVDQLPNSTHNLDYEGRSPEAAWREAAQTRIASHRMQDVRIVARDAAGNLVPDALIKLNMHQHAFGFGTVVALNAWNNHPQKETYQEKILNLTGDGRSFNIAVLENAMKWEYWENDGWPGTREQTAELVKTLRAEGIRLRGHNLLWPSFQWLPEDIAMNQGDPTYVRNRITNHIDDIMNFPGIKDNMAEWDVINEPGHLKDIATIFGSTDIYTDIFKQAEQNQPDAKLYVNDYDLITRMGVNLSLEEEYKGIIQDIEAQGGRVDGVGVQGHFTYPLTPPETVYEILDVLGAGGKSLSVTEYDARDVDEFMAGEYMRDILTICFSHPNVDNFLLWGIWDEIHWLDDSPFFREDWTIKPSGQAFLDLVFDEWWTQEMGSTDANGAFDTRAFLGTHIIEIEHNGSLTRDTIQLNGDQTTFEIQLDLPTNVNDLKRGTFQLGQNQPNPATGTTLIPVRLSQAGQVQLTLYNALGAPIRSIANEYLAPGSYQFELQVEDLPAGLYSYQLYFENQQASRKIIIRR